MVRRDLIRGLVSKRLRGGSEIGWMGGVLITTLDGIPPPLVAKLSDDRSIRRGGGWDQVQLRVERGDGQISRLRLGWPEWDLED